MFIDNVFSDSQMLCFFPDPNEDVCFEEMVEGKIAKYFNKLGVKHYCIHNEKLKNEWRRQDRCPVIEENTFTLRDLIARENAKLIWPQKSYMESGVPWLIRMIRLINKKFFINRVPYIYVRDWQYIPYFINLIRFRILEKGTKQRAESIRDFLLRTVPDLKNNL